MFSAPNNNKPNPWYNFENLCSCIKFPKVYNGSDGSNFFSTVHLSKKPHFILVDWLRVPEYALKDETSISHSPNNFNAKNIGVVVLQDLNGTKITAWVYVKLKDPGKDMELIQNRKVSSKIHEIRVITGDSFDYYARAPIFNKLPHERGMKKNIEEVAIIYKNRLPQCRVEGAGFFDQRYYNKMSPNAIVTSSEMNEFVRFQLDETDEWSHHFTSNISSDGVKSEPSKTDLNNVSDNYAVTDTIEPTEIFAALFDDVLGVETNNSPTNACLTNDQFPTNVCSPFDTIKQENAIIQDFGVGVGVSVGVIENGKRLADDEREKNVSTKRQKKASPEESEKCNDGRKTAIGQFFCNKKFMEDISRNGNLKMAIGRIPEKDRLHMEELHERGLTLARLFRIITKNNEGTLAEQIYCFYAIDYFIGSSAESRINPTRNESEIICEFVDQFSNENTLKNHCENRDLIDYVDSIKARKGPFCAGGLKFMAEKWERNSKEYTAESESMLIYAHYLITGELQPTKNRRPKDFLWAVLFEEDGEDNRE